MLTDKEIRAIQAQHPVENDPMPFARAIESALLAKLSAGVSVEPHYHNRIEADGTIVYVPWYTPEQLTAAIAQARVQAINECANAVSDDLHYERAIRALIGKETP